MRISEGDVVTHFKGNMYNVLHMNVIDCDDGEPRVVYMALYPPYQVYVRKQNEFLSEVPGDRENTSQKYRFEAN